MLEARSTKMNIKINLTSKYQKCSEGGWEMGTVSENELDWISSIFDNIPLIKLLSYCLPPKSQMM